MSEFRRRLLGGGEGKYIKFKDHVVAKICAETWGDGIGITKEQAAAVTDIGTTFRNNTEITSFNEFELFLGITHLAQSGFIGCAHLNEIKLPKSLKSSGWYAFMNCSNLLSIEIPTGFKVIPNNMFYRCTALRTVRIPQSITAIGEQAFTDCVNIKDVFATDVVSWCNIIMTDMNSNPMSSVTGANLYFKDIFVEHVDYPLLEVKQASFSGCGSIKSVNLLQGTTAIGNYSFRNCTKLSQINFPDALTSIGTSALLKTNLQHIDLPASIDNIGNYAFQENQSLKNVIIRAITPPTIGLYALLGSNCPIYVPDGSVDLYKTNESWSAYASRIKPISEYKE